MSFVIKRKPLGGIALLAKAEVVRFSGGYKIDISKPHSLIYTERGWENMWKTLIKRIVLNSWEIFYESEKNQLISEAFYESPNK